MKVSKNEISGLTWPVKSLSFAFVLGICWNLLCSLSPRTLSFDTLVTNKAFLKQIFGEPIFFIIIINSEITKFRNFLVKLIIIFRLSCLKFTWIDERSRMGDVWRAALSWPSELFSRNLEMHRWKIRQWHCLFCAVRVSPKKIILNWPWFHHW